MITVNVQIATEASHLPSSEQLILWAKHTLASVNPSQPGTVTLRLTDKPECQTLNKTYRQKDTPTNVLSFPYDEHEIGDIILCAPVIQEEAQLQNKTLEAHWAHLVIHGCLHCLGYDHITPHEADEMESLEISLLKELGFANPYEEPINHE